MHTQDIGGPSAGLAMTLGIMDKLSSGRLTGKRIVAATGTIDQNGSVGDVGGVAEKTMAVERAGATVFFVPSVEFQAAESKATPQLHVYAVNNLNQVLRILKRLGGKVPDQACAGPGGAVGSGHGRSTPPISSSRIAAGDIAHHTFAVVRRGFDSDEVRSYLQSVARSLEALEEREEELRAALLEAEERAAHPVVDEATLTASLGQHSAQILRHAHEEAARIVVQAQEGAATLLRETQSQVDELQARTEASAAERVVEVELLVANAEQEARVESERIIAEAVAAGEAIITRAKDEGRALLDQVQEARRRVLADLAARRRGLGIQIEQLRAARDEMAASVHGVRDRVDGILTQLDRTDEEARAAAQGVADQFRLGTAELPHDQDGAEGEGGEAPPTGPTPVVASPGGEVPEVTAAPSVDELFARIRAGATEPPEPAAEEPPPPTAKSRGGGGLRGDRCGQGPGRPE